MARSVYARAAARGFPVASVAGQTGQGALPDSTLPSGIAAGDPSAAWTDPNADPGSVVTGMAPPEEYILGQLGWGLTGTANPDDTPRTHAAPMADPTLPVGEYYAEADAAHAAVFNGVAVRNDVGTLAQFRFSQAVTEGSPAGPLQKLDGQIRSNAGFDGVQGYGGGGDGVNGTNGSMPLTVLDREFPGYTYHDVMVQAAETPFYATDATQFIAAEPSLPEWSGGGFDVPTASVNAQDVVAADTPSQGPPLAAPAGLLPLWGR